MNESSAFPLGQALRRQKVSMGRNGVLKHHLEQQIVMKETGGKKHK